MAHGNTAGGNGVMKKQGYVYIVTNKTHGTLYIGVTSDLVGRIYQHKQGQTPGFTQRYDATRLVWYEVHDDMTDAITREKQLILFSS
jgi:putative endonuclease